MSVWIGVPLDILQIFIVLSLDPEAKSCPSEESERLFTLSE